LIGALLFGAVCGLLGSFIVVRKMALFGDAISHAVLPGVALGFLWSMSKDPVAILIGATLAGLAGSLLVGAIIRTTRIKQDAALGSVLASLFAKGLCLIRIIQNNEGASKITGLKSYLFGDVAVLDRYDVITMGVVVIITVILFGLLYRPFLAISFDRQFAISIGFPVRILEALFQLFLAFAIVISLQAVGVVLVSAMLITPAATAYLLVDRLHRMLWIAMGVGMLSAVLGVFLSFLGSNLPTGPFMVLSASSIFTVAYFFSPKHGRYPNLSMFFNSVTTSAIDILRRLERSFSDTVFPDLSIPSLSRTWYIDLREFSSRTFLARERCLNHLVNLPCLGEKK
jgi:manganese/zinc/iron transport system permease protein